MQYLNIIYYLIITWVGLKFLRSDGRIIKSPFGDGVNYHFSGVEMFWVLTFSTGILAFSAPLGIDLMAIRLLTVMLLCIIGLGVARNTPVWSAPLYLYVLYLIWIIVGLSYSSSLSYGIRAVLKYLYPLVFCLFASSVITDFTVAIKSSLLARKIALITVILSFVPIIGYLIPGVMWYPTARAINYISIMIFSMALFFFTTQKKRNFWYVLIFLAPCFIWVLRTSIMGSGVAIMAFAIIRWRVKALPVIFAVLIGGVVAVFTIPSIKEKMFFETKKDISIEAFREGRISQDDIDTNARSEMWKILQNKFYEGHEVVGSGTGSVQYYMSKREAFGGLTMAHNDFVQIMCDNGLIGLILYISLTVMIFIHCFVIYWRSKLNEVKVFAITAGASIIGVLATMYSDNTVNYSMATLAMPYGFYGITLALNKRLVEE